MGKLIVIITSILFCSFFFYMAVNHDLSDFCNVRASEHSCLSWDVKTTSVFILTYLFYGALIGMLLSYLIKSFINRINIK